MSSNNNKDKNPFDIYLREVDVSYIPAQFVESVAVFYTSGNVVELTNDEILTDIVIANNRPKIESIDTKDPTIADVRVYVNTEKLQEYANQIIDDLFRKCNIL